MCWWHTRAFNNRALVNFKSSCNSYIVHEARWLCIWYYRNIKPAILFQYNLLVYWATGLGNVCCLRYVLRVGIIVTSFPMLWALSERAVTSFAAFLVLMSSLVTGSLPADSETQNEQNAFACSWRSRERDPDAPLSKASMLPTATVN